MLLHVSLHFAGHLEKSHKRTKDAAARTNNRSKELMSMMNRDILANQLNLRVELQRRQSLAKGDTSVAASTPGRALVPAVGSRSLRVPRREADGRITWLYYTALTDDLETRLLQQLQALLVTDGVLTDDEHLQMKCLRQHTGYKVVAEVDGEVRCTMALQCRDTWLGAGPRYDDVEVLVDGPHVEHAPRKQFAQLLTLLSYSTSKNSRYSLAFVRWYTNSSRDPDSERPKPVCSTYLAQCPINQEQSTTLISAAQLVRRVYILPDLQHTSRGVDDRRFFLNDSNNSCL